MKMLTVINKDVREALTNLAKQQIPTRTNTRT